jgi:long-chain acyl-CoA synthetase
MMPNVPQYPVAVAAILRAGFVVVNVNPLYTPRELEHQLKDSGARAIVILENFAATLKSAGSHAGQTCGVVRPGRSAGPAQGRTGQLCGAQRQEAGAGLHLPGAVRFKCGGGPGHAEAH